jgi:hypothetical protein
VEEEESFSLPADCERSQSKPPYIPAGVPASTSSGASQFQWPCILVRVRFIRIRRSLNADWTHGAIDAVVSPPLR